MYKRQAFGELFSRNITVYAYPALEKEGDTVLQVEDMPVPEEIHFLYQYLINSKHIVNVENPNSNLLHIIPFKIYESISSGSEGDWEDSLPAELPPLIKSLGAFGFGAKNDPFEYDKSDGQDAEYY